MPVKCPECGRFLGKDLVESIGSSPAPCPGCGTELRPDRLNGAPAPPEDGEGSVIDLASGTETSGSIRPPDLSPAQVLPEDEDVLADWDRGADVTDITAWQRDRGAGLPVDTVVVAAAAATGGLLGGLLAPRRRATGALLGALIGALLAGAARRIWRLE